MTEDVEALVEVRERRAGVVGEALVGFDVDDSCWVCIASGIGKGTGVEALVFADAMTAMKDYDCY